MAKKRANGEGNPPSGQMAAGRVAAPQATTQKPASASSRMSSARRRRNARQSWPLRWRPQRASTSAAPTNTPWPRGCGTGTTSTPSQMSVSPRQIAPHLHPRHPPKAGRSRTNNGQLYGTGDVSRSKKRSGRSIRPLLFQPFRAFPRVGHGVGQS